MRAFIFAALVAVGACALLAGCSSSASTDPVDKVKSPPPGNSDAGAKDKGKGGGRFPTPPK